MLIFNNGLIKMGTNAPLEPFLSNPSFAKMTGATPTNGLLTADGFTWAQSDSLIIDNFGKFISPIQWETGGSKYNAFVVSNDNGTTWSFPTHTSFFSSNGEGFILRGSVAYDTINDLLHVLWEAMDSNDGMIYRRYSINRDGSNNITGFTRVSGINLQLDNNGSVSYDHPVLLWFNHGTNGRLVAFWSVFNGGSGTGFKTEIRASMRLLSNTTDDNIAGNWESVATADTTTIVQSPNVPYTYIVSKAGTANGALPSVGVKNTDIYVGFNNGASVQEWQWNKLVWNGTNWNDPTTPQTITAFVRNGSDAGYSLKNELMTSFKYDSLNDRMYIAFPTWNNGDTWSFAYLDNTDTLSSIVDVYIADEADCSSNDFVTGDIMFDNFYNRLIVSYTNLPEKHIYMSVYDGIIAMQSNVLAFSARPFDIPTMYHTLFNDKVLCIGRDFNDESTNNPPTYTPPYSGYFGSVEFST